MNFCDCRLESYLAFRTGSTDRKWTDIMGNVYKRIRLRNPFHNLNLKMVE